MKNKLMLGLVMAMLLLTACTKSAVTTASTTTSEVNKAVENGKSVEASLLVTQDFGHHTVLSKATSLSEEAHVIALLEKLTTVDLGYDGSFVKAIAGISSSKRKDRSPAKDWFYYVNGVLSDVGARDYKLKTQDSVWWDCHEWGGNVMTPAVIGQYPEPFLHGYQGNGGALILYGASPNSKTSAEVVAEALKKSGVGNITLAPFSEATFKNRQKPCVIVGLWDELKSQKTLADCNEHASQTGANVYFTDTGMELLDSMGKAAETVSKQGGTIVATGTGMGDKTPAWWVIGLDSKSLSDVTALWSAEGNALQHQFGLALNHGKVVSLPVQKNQVK